MYHRIAEESFDPWGLAVNPANFGEHLRFLSASRTMLPLSEFAQRHSERRLPNDAVAVTFDDAYACTARVAAPLLEQQAVPATIFIPPDLIERGSPFWWDELENIVLDSEGDVLELDDATFGLGERQAGDRNWKPGDPPATPRQAAFLRLWEHLRDKSPKVVDRLMANLRAQTSVPAPGGDKQPMAPSEARAVAGDLIEIGSHALSHPSLPSLPREEKSAEIKDSVERCEALTGQRPRTFAYPFGDFDSDCEDFVRKAGYLCACSTEHRSVTAGDRAAALPRLTVGNHDAGVLKRVLDWVPA